MTFPTMSVTANGTIAALRALHPFTVSASRERRRVAGLLDSMNLVGRRDAPIRTLSGGNQQKVLLARWMLCDAQLLVLDEPTVGIDVVARAEIHALLRELAGRGVTVIVASADPDELVLLCNRAIVMVEGRVSRDLVAPFDADQMVAASYAGAH
jgi:ribose transport system ATP-binding protein/rhamnose transport system ATP-binding protein